MNLPDSFYIALCMTILLVGAVYWVWTQIQYVQRKVNVLENIVYELKTLCSRPPDPISPTQYPPAPPSVLGEDEDLLHETLRGEVEARPAMEEMTRPYATIEEVVEPVLETVTYPPPASPRQVAEVTQDVMEVQDIPQYTQETVDSQDIQEGMEVQELQDMAGEMDTFFPTGDEDLQPGGVGSGIVVPSLTSSLDTMTLKELRRLAQQKGISGATDMKKKELIAAIRAVPIDSFLE